MKKISAGLVAFRIINDKTEVLLAHPGGPFYRNKDDGFWSIVKGEIDPDEVLLEAAKREFREETGFETIGPFIELGAIKQKGGKTVHAWAFNIDYGQPIEFTSNKITIEWPPKTEKFISIPEIDQLQYFTIETARLKINEAQRELLERLVEILKINNPLP